MLTLEPARIALTPEKARLIVVLFESNVAGAKQLADRFHISEQEVYKIVNGQVFKKDTASVRSRCSSGNNVRIPCHRCTVGALTPSRRIHRQDCPHCKGTGVLKDCD
jgi:hypothetical protein